MTTAVALAGIVTLSAAGTIALTVYARWLERTADARWSAVAFALDYIPFISDVVALEHALPDLRDTYLTEQDCA